MKWITKITLHHYRAFDEHVPAINILPGHHLLIYGENGSGKSSLYHSLKDLIASSPKGPTIQFKRNVFSIPDNSGSVAITITDTVAAKTEEFAFNENDETSTHRKSVIQEANYFKGFLDYRQMLKLHFLEVPDGNRPNVFNLLVEDLLADVQIPDPYNPTGVVRVPLKQAYRRIKSALLRKYRWRTAGYLDHDLNALANFNSTFKSLLDTVLPKAQAFLNVYFKANIQIAHQTADIEYDDREIEEDSRLIVNYSGHNVDSYQYFLNEARLSAIALSINLASLKVNLPPAGTLKVLYLDDVFIGMDASNRLPLLDILDKEFINPTDKGEPTQVIISTYDRQWYETARAWLEALSVKVQTVEMFVETPLIVGDREKPIIMLPGMDYAEKAQAFYRQHDYAAAANAIRKACERLIKDILPRNRRLKEDAKEGTVLPIWSLEELFNQFKSFAHEVAIPLAAFTQFGTYKKILFNALSHDDATAPHFRKEIEAGLAMIKAFQEIRVKEHLTAEECATQPFRFTTVHAITKVKKNYTITSLESLLTIKVGTAEGFLRQVRCKVINVAGVEVTFNSFDAAHDAIWEEQGYPAPTDYDECRKHTKISNTKSMEALAKLLD